MRSFAKTFRAVLALCLVFSIVMSFVAVSADAVDLAQVSVADQPQLIEGKMLYEVKYNVTGVSAGSASILVHDAANVASITNESIEYVGQKAPTSGAAEFTMLLEKGDYTVIGGGTGMTADSETLSLDAAPVFAVERFEDTLLDNDEAGVAHPVATDADGDDVTYRLEGAAAANFAISGANIVINSEDTLAEGTYEFTLVATAGEKTASIPVAITIESSDVKVERFDDVAPVTVAWGTAADAIKFPAVTFGEEEFAATWACDTYNANVAGNYTFTATVSSKDGYDISAAAAPTVVVTVEAKNVTVLDALEPVDVDWGTELEAVIAKLPVTVTSGADTFDVKAWACDNYVAETGSYTFTATLVAKEGYNVTAIATVVVNVGEKPDVVIEAFDAVEPFAVAWGTAVEAIEFAAVTAKGETFVATWVCDNYNAEVAGDYTFTADVKDKEGYDISGAAALTVVVTVEAKVVDKLDALEAVDVDWGTELEAVIAKLPVTVTSGADTFDVEAWACDNYEAVTGSYTFTATLVEKAGYNVTAVATVVVNVGEEPDEVVAAFDPVAPFAVAWGTAAEAIKFPAVTYGDVVFDATWACADYNANKAGEYTFTATVADKDGYDISGAAELTVVVTVGQKVFAAENGEYTLNEDYYVDGVVNGDAVYVGGDAVVNITGGNYDGGYTPFGGAGNTAVFAYGNAVVNITGGNFTIGGLARNEEGVLDVGQVDMIYARENATINISGGTFKGADETVWLVNVKNDAYDAGTAKIVITGGTFINWDPTNGNGRGEKYIADGYYVKSAAVDGDIYYTVEKATVIEAFDAVEPITVAWGTAAEAIEFPAVTYGGVEFEATWACADYNANKAGEYTFTADVADKDGYNIKDAAELTVVVTVGQKVFAAESGEWTLAKDYYVEGTVDGDAVSVGGNAVVTITGGNYNGGNTPFGGAGNTAVFAYGNAVVNITGGNFTIGGLARNEEGVLDKGQIDMIYAKENATINISGGTFKGADETVWLVNVKNDAYDAGTAKIVITGGTFINWDPTNGNGRGEEYIADGYTVKAATVGTETHYTVVEKTAVNTIDPITVFVMPGDLYEDVILTVPTEITSGDVVITNIEWPEVIGETWPPVGEEALKIEAEDFDYNENDVTLAEDAVPSINFVTIPDTFELNVNDLENSFIVSAVGKAVVVDAEYNGPEVAGEVKFYYSIEDYKTGNVDVEKTELPENGVIEYFAGLEIGASKVLKVEGTVGDKDLVSKAVNVLIADDLFNGSIYNNATEANPEFSAVRINVNRDYTISFNIVGSNGAYDFSAGEFVVSVEGTELEGVVSGAEAADGTGKYTFTPEEMVGIANGSYTAKVVYFENGEEVYTKTRNVNITDRGFWYSEFLINGVSISGPRVTKANPFVAKITLDAANDENNVYAGFKVLPYTEELVKDGSGTTLVEGSTSYEELISVSGKANGAYSLYALANLTDSQTFYDLAVAKTIYVADSYTNLSGIFANGTSPMNPAIDGNDGNLVITPNWGGRKPSANLESYWTISLVDRFTGETIVLDQNVVEGATVETDGTIKVEVDSADPNKGFTIMTAKDVLPAKVLYVVRAYVDGVLDREVVQRVMYVNVD